MVVPLSLMDIQHYCRHTAERLGEYYTDSREAVALSRHLLEEVSGRSYPDLVLSEYKLTKKECAAIDVMVDRLLAHEPLQYILGRADFGELTLATDPRVLIPRPETAELCDRITEEGLLEGIGTAADIGTGTGAIALLLASRRPQLHVLAVDINPAAVELARTNARHLGLTDRVTVLEGDLLDEAFALPSPVGLVVSNPPYILERERSTMAPHVLEREPAEALFVPDDDPLLYYRALLDRCPAPRYALEINPLAAAELEQLFHDRGYATRFGEGFQSERRFLFAKREVKR